jgi:hypothetical protein
MKLIIHESTNELYPTSVNALCYVTRSILISDKISNGQSMDITNGARAKHNIMDDVASPEEH